MDNRFSESDAHRLFIEHSQTAYAFCDKDIAILYANEKFENLFVMPTFKDFLSTQKAIKLDAIIARIEKRGKHNIKVEIKSQSRIRVFELRFILIDNEHILIEVQELTKEKELEYMLDSYSRISEQNKKKLELSIETINQQKDELIKLNADLIRERNIVELRALQAVINPHFVSNCLMSIQKFIVANQVNQSIQYVSQFGKLMRLSFEQAYIDYVSIADVIGIIKIYVEIERMRITNDWKFIIQIDEKLNIENLKIPPMLIQPFIENAIWHGVSKVESEGEIILSMEQMNEFTLRCTVINQGKGKKNIPEITKKKSLHSLNVTKKRLDILWKEYNKQYDITYSDIEDKETQLHGKKVEIMIPINF